MARHDGRRTGCRQDGPSGSGGAAALTDYIRYEFEWGFVYNVEAGEDIRVLDLTDRPGPGLPDHDFWLFDDQSVVKMMYRPDGTQIARELTDVERILSALRVSEERQRELIALARLANMEFQSVRAGLQRGLHQKQRELASLEADSQHIRFFLPLMITGLLQTPEYARASLANFPGDHPQAIVKRLDRQARLYDASKRFTFVLTEAAVRWQLCEPPVMAVQMDRLASLSALPNIRLGIITIDTYVPDGALNTFTIYDERIATAETFGGVIMMRDPRDVAYHLELFAFFEQYATFDDDAKSLLSSYAAAFRRTAS